MRRARPRHDLRPGRRSPSRWSAPSAACSTRRSCASATATRCSTLLERDRPPRGPGRPARRGNAAGRGRRSAATRRTSPRTSRGWRCPATSRAPCRRWPWASPSAAAAPTTTAAGAYEADFSAAGRPPARLARGRPPRRRDRGPGRPDRLADPVQVPPRRLQRPLRRERPTCCAPVTGWDVTADELRVTAPAHRHRQEAVQPARRLDAGRGHAAEAVPVGGVAGRRRRTRPLPRERLEAMVAAYYRGRGWDEAGRVPRALAQDLGLV